ncbi:hypothetical protein AAFC00_003239 [Neodothiora populina]
MASIPVIDISASNPNAATDMLCAAIDFGFVYVENNEAAGVPAQDVAGMFELSKQFFQSPTEMKETCSINSNKAGKNKGWLSMHTETLDPSRQKRGDFKEAFNLGEPVSSTFPQPLAPPLDSNIPTLLTFTTQCHNLCKRILQLFAQGLSLGDKNWFSDRHDQSKGPSGSILRLLYYPDVGTMEGGQESERSSDDIRAGAHSDYGSVTLLFQLPGQPGLQILTPEGEWVGVPVDPSSLSEAEKETSRKPLPILVNIGDLLAYWTNGLLRSTVHRVVFPHPQQQQQQQQQQSESDKMEKTGDRYSIAYFCHPLDDARLIPVPSKMVDEYKGGVKGMTKNEGTLTARDHLNERLAATYGMKK